MKKVTLFSSLFLCLFMTSFAYANDGGISLTYGIYAFSAAMAIGLPVIGGTLGQSKAAVAALEGIARNPGASQQVFVPMILCMALIESLVLFGLIISFILVGKVI